MAASRRTTSPVAQHARHDRREVAEPGARGALQRGRVVVRGSRQIRERQSRRRRVRRSEPTRDVDDEVAGAGARLTRTV